MGYVKALEFASIQNTHALQLNQTWTRLQAVGYLTTEVNLGRTIDPMVPVELPLIWINRFEVIPSTVTNR